MPCGYEEGSMLIQISSYGKYVSMGSISKFPSQTTA